MKLRITSNEKAVAGGLITALFTVIVQLQQQSGGFTLHDFLVALAGYVVAHLAVWLTTNSPKPPVSPAL